MANLAVLMPETFKVAFQAMLRLGADREAFKTKIMAKGDNLLSHAHTWPPGVLQSHSFRDLTRWLRQLYSHLGQWVGLPTHNHTSIPLITLLLCHQILVIAPPLDADAICWSWWPLLRMTLVLVYNLKSYSALISIVLLPSLCHSALCLPFCSQGQAGVFDRPCHSTLGIMWTVYFGVTDLKALQ